MLTKISPRLRELAPIARGSQDAGSRNLGTANLTISVQNCVKTFLLSSEYHPQNVPPAHPKIALWRNISASRLQNLAGMFLHYSVHKDKVSIKSPWTVAGF